MTQEQKRIAIAEACGWKLTDGVTITGTPYKKWVNDGRAAYAVDELPDYLNDLNAMHEAEETLGANDKVFFVASLFGILGLDCPSFEKEARPNDFYFAVAHATAAQRAEAFGRTLGLWKE
jgi:hypothetical protein